MSINPEVLFRPETLTLLDSLEESESESDIVRTISQLRAQGHSQEVVHQALEQLRLRRKAAKKFGSFAQHMLFTESGLEQASRLAIAAHHAGRFQRHNITSVADLGCGIGADSMAFAGIGMTVLAIDRDETTAAVASYNLAPFDTVEVRHGDALAADLSSVEGVWLDPARRDSATRLSDPADWSPTLDEAFALARTKPSGIKLAPGMDRDLIPDDCEAQWVSHKGEVVELVLWWGALSRPGIGRSALLIGDDRSVEMTGASDSTDAPVRDLGQYLYEPDGAVIRARLIGDLARELDGGMLSADIAYITSDTKMTTAFAQSFEITDVLPAKVKDLTAWVRTQDIGTLEIKKRGVDIDPAALREKLSPQGSREATIILTRYQGKRVALAARRVG